MSGLIPDFVPGGIHAGIYSALSEGYFEEANLNVDIQPPTSSADTLRLLLADQATIGIAPVADVASLRAQEEQGPPGDGQKLMRSLGANKARIFREVRIPVALPYVFPGAKVGATFSMLGAVFGEWVGSRGGPGYVLLLENRAVNTDTVFAIILMLSVLGIGFFGLVVLLERITIPWYRISRDND